MRRSLPCGIAERLGAADLSTLTDARVSIIKAALQLTPDQEKYWPAIEMQFASGRRDSTSPRRRRGANCRTPATPVPSTRCATAIRSISCTGVPDALAQRSADLNKLADAWQPLYQTLTPDQKKRMGFLAISVVREMSDRAERRRMASEDENED